MIVATPGRLQDLVDRRLLSLDAVEVLVLDEADRMLDMGFKPQVDRLVRLLRDDRQTMFFSATLDGEVGELARRYTHFPARFEGELPADRRTGDVDHRFVPVTADNKVSTLVDLLRQEERGLVLVFVRTKAGADRLVEKLRRHDVDAVAIHGDKGQAQREQRARALRRRQGADARRDRRRGARARRRRHHARDQLRPARGAGRLHAPRRPHRPRRPRRHRHHARAARAAGGRLARRAAAGPRRAFEETGMQVAKPRLVYTSRRRGGRSKW